MCCELTVYPDHPIEDLISPSLGAGDLSLLCFDKCFLTGNLKSVCEKCVPWVSSEEQWQNGESEVHLSDCCLLKCIQSSPVWKRGKTCCENKLFSSY